ncbi:MAG TPA: DinB family protein [Bryobacteraceae bacterium]|jgi:uncharacterized damage-inducible protein DinB|nr:DinB family protein [Bryobacteraceae bacterium]
MRPASNEHAPYYAKYIGLAPDGDIVSQLKSQIGETIGLLSPLSDAAGDFRYAPDKWSLKEVLGHMIDTERIFSFRALSFARGDRNPLPGFEQDDYVRAAGSNERTLKSLVEEFEAVRRSTVLLFGNFSEAAWQRRGIASGNEVTVRALAWIIAGHELHHRRGIAENYLR